VDETGDLRLAHLPARDGEHHVGKVVFRRVEVVPVQRKEYQGSDSADALVAVQEGMVLHEMKEVSSRHLLDVGGQELAAVGGCRHAEGGLEQLDIPDLWDPAVAGNLVSVDGKDLDKTEKRRPHWLFCESFQRLGIACVHLVERGLERPGVTSILDRGKNQDLAVGGYLEARFRIRFQQI
jgi:hypothetical protein